MKTVIIIGASYAGLYALKEISKDQNLKVLIFDKNSYHFAQVESYGLASGIYTKTDVSFNINEYTDNLNVIFKKSEISSFDSISKVVTTSNNINYSYDYLIIATGSLTNFPINVPNIKKFATGIKVLENADNVKKDFFSMIEESQYRNKKFNIVIGGAGLSGVELASEMANLLKEKELSNKINIILVDGLKTVLSSMDERLILNCMKRLEDLNIQIKLGSFIKNVDEEKIYLLDGSIIDYDYFIFTGGIRAVTLDSNKEFEKNKLNQYLSDEYLNLKGEKDIFVIGDVSQVIYNDIYIPPTAQLAIQSAKYVASIILNENPNKKIKKFKPESKGVLISLGGNYALGLINNKYFFKGRFPYYLKKITTSLHMKKFQ